MKRPTATGVGTAASPVASALSIAPGLALCVAAALVSVGMGRLVSGLPPLLVAIVLGMVVGNATRLAVTAKVGVDFSAKKLLRAGIVLLGLQLVLSDIVALGAPMLAVVMVVVAGGLLGTVALGRVLRVQPGLTLLIACGFSICGAAAVAAAAGVTDPEDEAEEHTITAVALVVIFGTLMIPAIPVLARSLRLDDITAGLWAGASIHEIAQVVAVGGILGGSALSVAVVVKLARVLLLAPVMAVLSARQRRRHRGAPADPASAPQLPPLVPLFVIGFLVMILVRSFVPVPSVVLDLARHLQTGLLAAAMFALGCGVRVAALARVGVRPFALAACSTLLVAALAYVGIRVAA